MVRKLICLVLLAIPAFGANVYWVDDNGAASWAAAESDTPLSGTACTDLATACSNVVAGDTVYLRAGDYTVPLYLDTKAGTSGSRIVFEGYQSEQVTIKNVTNLNGTYPYGIGLINSDYITITKIDVEAQDITTSGASQYRPFYGSGSDYNIIDDVYINSNCVVYPQFTAVKFFDCTHWWLKNVLIEWTGDIDPSNGNDRGGPIVGDPTGSDTSAYWTVENSVFRGGAHHNWEFAAPYSVFRNNYLNNDSWMDDYGGNSPENPDDNGLYGNRNLAISQTFDNPDDPVYNLVEGNRIGPSGTPSDDNGEASFVLAAADNVIVRYNEIYLAESMGFYPKSISTYDSDDCTIYNMTIFDVGNWPAANTQLRNEGFGFSTGTTTIVAKNNLIWDPSPPVNRAIWAVGGANTLTAGGTFSDNYVGSIIATDKGYEYAASAPDFVDTTLNFDSETVPDLSLQSSSAAIDAGGSLTLANGSGSSSTSLVVDNAMFFQDGTWGSSLASLDADWIAIGTVSNIVEISSINYGTDTITLASAMTWSDNDDIWLYSKSDGIRVLYGSAPDQGAHEYSGAETGSATLTRSASSGIGLLQ